jgi:ribosomal protein S21
MANKVRARAEMKSLSHNASEHERFMAFKTLLLVFKRRCNEYGIMHSFKEHEYFESKPRKERRKRKEAELRRLKEESIHKGYAPQSKSAQKKDRRS